MKTLLAGGVTAGNYAIQCDATSLPSGVYYYALECNGGALVKQFTIVR